MEQRISKKIRHLKSTSKQTITNRKRIKRIRKEVL
jgi:hypothetical protein